jgi:hypothetical protein
MKSRHGRHTKRCRRLNVHNHVTWKTPWQINHL